MTSPSITFPESLPISAKREEIAAAIAAHQVVIVCGETGSGKTTQLPKIALAMGRGKLNYPGGKGPLIGHTQPRRIAASSVAKRIAEELKTPLGEVVGFKVRFQDRLSRDASVKLMTDGILLAETQTDPLLKAYDTIIIDEAHERSLNIDFLLGYLREILPRRPDLKVIVTSATIDADRFAQHFASARGPAPVIYVSGRMYPVEQRWRPFEESRDYGLNEAIADGVDELWQGGGGGDVLVFLPGEREIREAADHLRKHLAHSPLTRNAEVLPLFARLSQPEQDRIFDNHGDRRIVLATNVAETSLTVPGIRYVIDAGTARVKRYSFRSKVEQLLVEPISQAAANQRAGRCGRVANGICIRLYDEKDFAGRPRFTDPEILRSSLAGVILRMKSLRFGAVEDFPFLEAPSRRAIADGYQLLNELGAVDDANELTATGAELAKLPLDPRVGRMILEARTRGALEEVLVIASALSVQDVRDRPMDMQTQADQQHAKFDDEKSEFSGYLKLWKWIDEARGGHGKEHKLSNRQYEQLLRQNFVNVRRVREWRDIHTQLHTVVAEHKWRLNAQPASYEELHKSMLAGLLGNIGVKPEDEDVYLGARGIKFYRHPGAHLRKKPGRWIVCAELVETTRLFGRGIANIEPLWIEQVAGHLLKKQLLDPHWEKKAAEVMSLERATLYGLVIYSGRRVPFARVDMQGAREIFIREGLVAGQWETKLPFLAANQKLVKQVEEHRAQVAAAGRAGGRGADLRLLRQVHSARRSQRLHVRALVPRGEPRQPRPAEAHARRADAARGRGHHHRRLPEDDSPGRRRLRGELPARARRRARWPHGDGAAVRAEPGERGARGVAGARHAQGQGAGAAQEPAATAAVPLRAAARIGDAAGRAPVAARCVDERFAHGRLAEDRARGDEPGRQARRLQAGHAAGAPVHEFPRRRRAWPPAGHGAQPRRPEGGAGRAGARRFPGAGGDEGTFPLPLRGRAGWGRRRCARPPSQPSPEGGGAKPAPAGEHYTAWTFGELPELMEVRKGGTSLIGFPALIDKGDAVAIEVFDEPDVAAAKHRAGLRRLFALQLKDALKYLEKNIPDLQKMAVAYMPLGTQEELREQIIEVALDRAFLQAPLPGEPGRLHAPRGRGPRPPDADRQRSGPAGGDRPGGLRDSRAQGEGHQGPPGNDRRRNPATAAPGAQAVPGADPLDATAALSALPEGDHAAAGQAARRSCARCGEAGRAQAAGATLLAARWRSARAPWTSGCRSFAGCWRNCA